MSKNNDNTFALALFTLFITGLKKSKVKSEIITEKKNNTNIN